MRVGTILCFSSMAFAAQFSTIATLNDHQSQVEYSGSDWQCRNCGKLVHSGGYKVPRGYDGGYCERNNRGPHIWERK